MYGDNQPINGLPKSGCGINMSSSQGGKQNIKDTGLINVPNDEISRRARDKNLSGEERRRYQKEEKARGDRNKQKRKNK